MATVDWFFLSTKCSRWLISNTQMSERLTSASWFYSPLDFTRLSYVKDVGREKNSNKPLRLFTPTLYCSRYLLVVIAYSLKSANRFNNLITDSVSGR